MGKVVIDKSKCIECFNCKRVCYEVFEIGDDGLARVRPDAAGNTKEAESAIIACPTGAIRIEDSNYKSTSLSDVFFKILENSNKEDE